MIPLQGPSQIIENDEILMVERIGKVLYKDGKPVDRDVKSFQIICNVQPIDGRELLLVPEGDRDKEQYWVWMNQKSLPLQLNDRVIRVATALDSNKGQEANYEVKQIQNWGSYTAARIVRVDVGKNATY